MDDPNLSPTEVQSPGRVGRGALRLIPVAAVVSLVLVGVVVVGDGLVRSQTVLPNATNGPAPPATPASATSALPTSASPTSTHATPAPTPALSARWIRADPTLSWLQGRHSAVVMGDGRVLVVGADAQQDPIQIYDPATGQWSVFENRAAIDRFTSRWDVTAVSLSDGGAFAVAGAGRARAGRWTDIFREAGAWERGPNLREPRVFAAVVQLGDGRILAAGGGRHLATAEIVSLDSGDVARTGRLTVGRNLAEAVLLSDGRVLVTGGNVEVDFDVDPTTATVEIYDPATGHWSMAAPMHVARKWHTATLLPDGRVLIVGGNQDRSGTPAEIYDPKINTWTDSEGVGFRSGHGAALLGDGRVLVVGGSGLAKTELFDPATNTWADGPALLTALTDLGLVTLDDGSIMVMGGHDIYTWTNEVEILRVGDIAKAGAR